MSIATTHGDRGDTSLVGGRRISKGSLRIEAIGDVDELGAHLALARAMNPNAELRDVIKDVQRQLFAIGEMLATDGEPPRTLDEGSVDRLTAVVHRLEAIDGIVADWVIAGDHVAAAACDLARASCRRAERSAVRLKDAGDRVDAVVLAYLNRLADVLWLMSRTLEHEAGIDARLRDADGPRWSKAW